MSKLHPRLRGSLSMLPKDKPVSLLTRHSLREKADQAIVSYRAPLTQEGIELATQWGSEINKPIAGIYSSPVGRCVDTANAMLAGAMLNGDDVEPGLAPQYKPVEVQVSSILVEPGCFVHDVNLVGPQFLRIGPVAFFNRHINESMEGILSPREGVCNLLAYLHSKQAHEDSLVVHVTHDTILAAFVYHLMAAEKINHDLWPWMLEGTFLWFDDEHVHWTWRGQSYLRPLASLSEGLL